MGVYVVPALAVLAQHPLRLTGDPLLPYARLGEDLGGTCVCLLLALPGGGLRVGERLLRLGQRGLGAGHLFGVPGVERRRPLGLLALRLGPALGVLLVLFGEHPDGALPYLAQRGERLGAALLHFAPGGDADLVGLGARDEQALPGALLRVGAYGVGVRLRRVPHTVRTFPRRFREPPRLLPCAVTHGRGLLQPELEEPARTLPERLVRLRSEPRDPLAQRVELRLHLLGEHGETGGALPGDVTVLGERGGVRVDLFGVVATPYGHEAVGRDRCAAHPGTPLHPDVGEMMISRTS